MIKKNNRSFIQRKTTFGDGIFLDGNGEFPLSHGIFKHKNLQSASFVNSYIIASTFCALMGGFTTYLYISILLNLTFVSLNKYITFFSLNRYHWEEVGNLRSVEIRSCIFTVMAVDLKK